MHDEDFFNSEDLKDNEEKKVENSFFDLLNEKSLKNIFVISELLNVKKFESE